MLRRFNFIMLVIRVPWIAWLLACLMAGCSSAATDSSSNSGPLYSLIAIIDFDSQSFVPALPDDLKSPPGSSSSHAGGPPPASKAVELPVVYFYYAPFDCPGCKRHAADAPGMTGFRFIKGLPDEWSKRHATAYPYFRWQVKGQWTGETIGWTTPAAFRLEYKQSLNRKTDPKTVAGEPRSSPGSAGSYFPATVLSTGHWWLVNELKQHLADDHGIDTFGMSAEELAAAHDAVHSSYSVKRSRKRRHG